MQEFGSEKGKPKSCLYVSILNIDSSIHWYIISHQPYHVKGDFAISRVDDLNLHRETLYLNYACVAWRHMIYFLGGTVRRKNLYERSKPHNKVFVYHIPRSDFSSDFVESGSMKCARDYHVATTIDTTGEIYVFGHRSHEILDSYQWAEYYSPQKDMWNYLPIPPPEEVEAWPCPDGLAVHEPTKTIYLWKICTGFVSYCYGDEKKWVMRNKIHCPSSRNAAVKGHLLFWTSHDKEIYVYSLVSHTMILNAKDYTSCSFYGPHLVRFPINRWCEVNCKRGDGELNLDQFMLHYNRDSGALFYARADRESIYIGPENYYIQNVLKGPGPVHSIRSRWRMMFEILLRKDFLRKELLLRKPERLEMGVYHDPEETFMLIYNLSISFCLVGEIIHVFEEKGFKLKGLYHVLLDEVFAQKYCWEIENDDAYDYYMECLISSPVIAIIWEGINVVTEVAKTIGPPCNRWITDIKTTVSTPYTCNPWIINKGRYIVEIPRDMIDYSDSVETARRRISWFLDGPLTLGSRLKHLYACDPKIQEKVMTGMELALIVIRPEYVAKGCVGEIIHTFEKKGFYLKGLKLTEDFVTMVWSGIDVVKHIERTIEATEEDIFASWINVEGSFVKINRSMISLFEMEEIDKYFAKRVKVKRGKFESCLDLIID